MIGRLRRDAKRMAAMRVAHEFGRLDVDAMLEECDVDQFAEWDAYFALRPAGWEALRIVATRLAYTMAQVRTSKKLREADYQIRTRAEVGIGDDQLERLKWEALSVRSEIEAEIAGDAD